MDREGDTMMNMMTSMMKMMIVLMICTMGKGTMMLIMNIEITTNRVMIGMMIMTKMTMYMMMKCMMNSQ